MASIYKRGKSWVLTWRESGDQQRRSLGVIQAGEAKLALAAKEVELATGTALLRRKEEAPTFREFVPRYLAWFEGKYPASLQRVQNIIVVMLLGHFGELRLDAIDTKVVDAWQVWRAKEKSRRVRKGAKPTTVSLATVDKELRQLKAVLNKAVEWGVISGNPCRTRQYKKGASAFGRHGYTDAQLAKLYAASGPRKSCWKLMANTGLRVAEACNCDASDVGATHLQVENRYDSIEDHGKRTKGDRSRRVPLTAGAREALADLPSTGALFPKVHKNSLGRMFKRDAVAAGLPGSLYWLRHTFISRLANGGVPLPKVQRWAGHIDIATTMGYVHDDDACPRVDMATLNL